MSITEVNQDEGTGMLQMNAAVDSVDRTDAVDALDAVNAMDAVDRVALVDSVGALDSLDRIAAVDAMDALDAFDHADAVDSADALDSLDRIAAVDALDAFDRVGAAESADALDRAAAVDGMDSVERANAVDALDAIDRADVVDAVDAMGIGDAAGSGGPGLRVLWVVDPDFGAARHHGAVLRYLAYAREMVARGHQVWFMVDDKQGDGAEKRRHLEALRRERTITGYVQLRYAPERRKRRVAAWLGHPAAGNRLLRSEQAEATARLQDVVEREGIDVCIFSDRDLLFAAPRIAERVPTLIDWADCFVLYMVRLLAEHARRGAVAPYPRFVRHLAQAALLERHYGRRVDANLVVSPVDKRWMDGVNGRPSANHVLLNGVRAGAPPRVPKVPGRIVFSGNMDFPPNVQAALWFMDRVLPRIVERRPEVTFVIAGANPVEELRARAGGHVRVTGFVDDMPAELARGALYVAPLVSGGGFKNKVVEAIAAGTYVVATSMAAEFLPPAARAQLAIADTPAAMADAVLDCLDAPERYVPRLAALRAMLEEEFDWGTRTDALIAIIQGCIAARAA
jgi:glycosyltransferase involved in cell wall biosynthesis